MDKDTIQAQAAKVIGPVKELNKLALQNIEKVIKMQISSLEDYAKMGLENCKNVIEVENAEGLKDVASQQKDVAQNLAQKISEDAKAVVEMTNSYAASARKIVEDIVTTSKA